ncbi:MAG: tRNA 2-thiouridine(34) synthase MnmA [bacterium]
MSSQKTKTVAVAMSGGVDSSTTAVLLKEQGYRVIGLTGIMRKGQDVSQRAKAVCDKFGMEHYTLDVSDYFQEEIVDYFKDSYKNAKTPNPCIVCNKKVKWGKLFDYAINELGADYYATGHYAKIEKRGESFVLKKAKDPKKDQLYFLFELSQEQLSRTIFPMGDFEKPEVREIAQKYDIPSKNTKDSQDICFLLYPDTTKKFLLREFGETQGEFVDINTKKVLGTHNGFYQFTIGQRKGIGLAAERPLYVVDLDPCENIVYVGFEENLYTNELEIQNPHFQQKDYIGREFTASVKIRYNTTAKEALIIPDKDKIRIVFNTPQSAVTKGQAAVIYDEANTFLIGGGWIK